MANTNHKKTRQILLWIGISLVSLVLLLAAAGWILSHTFEEEVRVVFEREVNKRLNTTLTLERINLSVLRHFPYASVTFYNLKIKDAGQGKSKNNMLTSDEASLEFSIADLFRSKFSIIRMRLQKADIHLHVYADGTDNFHLLKPEGKSGNGEFSFDIQKLIINNTLLSYINEASAQDYNMEVGKATFTGKFSQDTYDLGLQGTVFFRKIISQDITYHSNDPALLDLQLNVDNRIGKYTFNHGDLQLGQLKLSLTGNFIYNASMKLMDIVLQSGEADLQDLIQQLPPAYRKYFNNYKASGKFAFNLTSKGKFGGENLPVLAASFRLRDGSLKRSSTGIALRDLRFEGQFRGKQPGNPGDITFRKLSARLEGGSVQGSFKISDFANPRIEGNLLADADLAAVYGFLPVGYLTALNGKAKINASFSGHPGKKGIGTKAAGTITISGTSATFKGSTIPLSAISGNFTFNNNDLKVNNLNGRYGSSDFLLQGAFRNFMACMLQPSLQWQLDARLISGNLNWDEVMAVGQTNESAPPALQVPVNLALNLDANIGKLSYRAFTARQIHGQLTLHNGTLTATALSFDAMNGHVTSAGSIDGLVASRGRIRCKAHFEKVDIKQMFESFGNFGNKSITEKNLEGTLTSDLNFAANWMPGPEIDIASVVLNADLVVENGRLKDYSPMLSLSKYLRVEDLSDIRFSTLSNRIEIARKTVYIPRMEIKSNAIDLQIYGKHGFDNRIDYHFRILLSQLLWRKARKNNPNLKSEDAIGPIQDDGLGRTTLYLLLTGTVDKPIFKYDKKDVREKIAADFKKERQNLKSILRHEFVPARKDSVSRKTKKDETKFEVEWDDEPK